MRCNNCKKDCVKEFRFCPLCGAEALDNKFCVNCGIKNTEGNDYCTNCGEGMRTSNLPSNNANGKSKTTAVLLAIFLGNWTWIYTYKIDKKKFWIALILLIITSVISDSMGDNSLYLFSAVCIYIWAIVTAISRNSSFYKNY